MPQPHTLIATQSFASRADEIPRARRFVRRALEDGDVAGRAHEILLMVSELVTNGVVHGQGDISVRVLALAPGGRVRVEVSNRGPDDSTPHLVKSGPQDISGRGLDIVDQLAAFWGTERDRAGSTRVWFEVDPN